VNAPLPPTGELELRHALVGSWRLERWQIAYPATGRTSTPFGDDAEGLIVYAPDGYMSVVLRRRARIAERSASETALSEQEKAACFSSYMHYAGRWHIDGSDVVHEIEHALHPDLTGTQQRRHVELRGDVLLLTGDECYDAAGSVRAHRVSWRRAR
jgi:hypothetical protein